MIIIDTPLLEAEVLTLYTILTASDNKTKEIYEATKSDAKLVYLKALMQDGWPYVFMEMLNI